MKRLFKWLLFLLLALAIGVAALLFNPALIKTPLENYLSNLVGYPVSLEGTLEIDVGSQLEITAANIVLSAPDWSSERQLISIAYLNLVIETSSLFKDIGVLDSIQVDGLHVNLETNVDGVGNWTIKRPPKEKPTKKKAGARVVFKTIHLSNANFGYFNGEAGFEHHLQLTSLEQQQRENGMLHIDLIGDYNDKPLVINGSLGRFEDLLAMTNISYDFSGNFGTLKMQSSGLIDDLMQPRRPRFDLLVEGPDIDEVTAALGLDDLGSGQFSLQAKGTEVDDHYETSIYGDIDDVSLNVSAQLSDLSKMEELDLSLAFNGPSLGAVTRAFGIKEWPDKPFRLNAKVKRVGDTLNVPDLTLLVGGTELVLDALLSNFPHFDASRVKLTVTGDDIVQFRQLLGIPGVASGPFKIRGKMDVSPESVELVEVEINSSLGHATLSGTLAADPKYIGSKLHLHLDGDSAYAVMSALNVEALPEQPFSMDARVEVVEHGLLIERGVLVTIEDERLELGGRLSFLPGSVGTDLDVKLYGMHLNSILRRLVGDTEVPDQAYNLTGRISFREDGIQLDKVKAAFAGIELETGGLLIKGDQPLSSGLDFDLNGTDLSALGEFKIIGDSLDMFVPGQPYKAAGRFSANGDGWRFDKVSGRIGQTDLAFSGLISSQAKLAGSNINFLIKGPDAHSLFKDQNQTELPSGPFETSGQISLSASTLTIKDLMFENQTIHGAVQLDLGWPISREIDASFDVSINGDDIRYMLPQNEIFELDLAAFKINAIGRKKGDLISIKTAEADIGKLNVKLHGKLDEASANENSNITLSVTSTDLSSLGKIYGARPQSKALMVNTAFIGNAKQFLLRDIAITLGESSVSGQMDVSLKGEIPDIKATLRSDHIDIRPWQDQNDADNDAVDPNHSDRLIPPTPLPLKALAAADVELNLQVTELKHTKDSLDNIVIEAVMQSGELRVEELAFEGPRGKVEASFSITPTSNDNAAVVVDLRADDLVLNLTGQGDETLDKAPKIDIRLHANSSGGNLQELAGSSNGSLMLGSRGGELRGVNLSVLDTFILDEVFSMIMPKTDVSDDLDLTCAAAVLKITDGNVESNPAVAFTTSRITLVSKGSVNLKTEEMKLNFTATPNNALKLSASELFNPYILVGGTLANPAVGLDPGKVILHGGAAIGTAGLSILAKGLLDRVGTAMPICEDMLETVEAKQ